MKWIIQHTGLPDSQTLRLLEAVKERGIEFVPVGHIPFSHEITGLEDFDPSTPAMFYGSIQLTQQLYNSPLSACTLYKPEWFDPRLWRGYRPDLLNENLQVITPRDLRARWVNQPTFVKSVDPKVLKGMVLEPVKEDWDNWLIEESHLDAEELLVASPLQVIDKEWRFFILDGQVITGSLYKRDGYLCYRESIEEETWKAAREAAKLWMPSRDIVMDIALLRSGEYRVIEFNCVNSSGFYNADVGKIVDHLQRRFHKGM